jgi:DNA-binding PadR family transcriptional regulator
MLHPTLLLLLHRGPAHGYTLLEQVREFGLVGLDPSVVYRTLRDMEAQGSVTSSWDDEQTQGPPRRVYRLTTTGDEALGAWMGDLQAAGQRIAHLLDAYDHHMELGEGEYH